MEPDSLRLRLRLLLLDGSLLRLLLLLLLLPWRLRRRFIVRQQVHQGRICFRRGEKNNSMNKGKHWGMEMKRKALMALPFLLLLLGRREAHLRKEEEEGTRRGRIEASSPPSSVSSVFPPLPFPLAQPDPYIIHPHPPIPSLFRLPLMTF